MSMSPEEETVLQILESSTPKSVKEIAKILSIESSNPERLAKEIAWKLVEEGKAKFNSNWELEGVSTTTNPNAPKALPFSSAECKNQATRLLSLALEEVKKKERGDIQLNGHYVKLQIAFRQLADHLNKRKQNGSEQIPTEN